MRTTFVPAVLLAAMLASQSPTPSTPPAPTAVRLVYEMPVDALQRALRGQTDRDLEQVLTETVANVQARLGDDAKVARQTAIGFTVDLANADAAAIDLARRRIETVGKLEMRIVADGDYCAGDVRFALAAERAHLVEWLDAGGREKLRADATAIDAYHADTKGPLAGKNLRWFVHRIGADTKNAGWWQPSLQTWLRDACVPAYTDEDWNRGAIPARIQELPLDQRFLVEFVAVNMHEVYFQNRDLDPKGIGVGPTADGGFALHYRTIAARAADYANWSEKYLGKCAAILWNDEVLMVPCFMSRIPGRGQISGSLSATELETMQRALQAPPLAARPRFVRQEPGK
jgi:hypothetical protein